MNWEREYIIQTYENAANNLRLNSHRLINHTLLKEFLSDCEKLERSIDEMKKITELAKLGVRLGKSVEFTHSVPQFISLSSAMKEQVNELIPIVREVLDGFAPEELASKLEAIKNAITGNDVKIENVNSTDAIVEVVNLIREVDDYLNLCSAGSLSSDDKEKFVEIVSKINSALNNFSRDLIIEMKNIFIELFNKIISRGFSYPEEIEAMRACLIVTVAELKEKDVDVSQFIALARNSILEKEEE